MRDFREYRVLLKNVNLSKLPRRIRKFLSSEGWKYECERSFVRFVAPNGRTVSYDLRNTQGKRGISIGSDLVSLLRD